MIYEGKKYYKASCWVAAAEMAYSVTAEAYINGVMQDETDSYSVREYGMEIINNPSVYGDKLVTLAKEMLNYGAKAQLLFGRKTNDLANNQVTGYTMADVKPDNITSEVPDLSTGLETFGLSYYATSVVFLTKNTLRLYYKIEDKDTFDTYKSTITLNGEHADYISKSGYIYFEVSDIPAAELNTAQVLTIGEGNEKLTYSYSVLDFARRLTEDNCTEAEQNMGKATYLYFSSAKEYFDSIKD